MGIRLAIAPARGGPPVDEQPGLTQQQGGSGKSRAMRYEVHHTDTRERWGKRRDTMSFHRERRWIADYISLITTGRINWAMFVLDWKAELLSRASQREIWEDEENQVKGEQEKHCLEVYGPMLVTNGLISEGTDYWSESSTYFGR